MTLASRVLARLMRLPPAQTHDILVERGLAVPMRDGVILRADRFAPRGAEGAARAAGSTSTPTSTPTPTPTSSVETGPSASTAAGAEPPTILLRSPYGRRGVWPLVFARLFAERGFNVVLQSVRGTFDSGGTFTPYLERDDGLDTIAWIERQPWFSGTLATTGPSYLGFTQWASVTGAGPRVKAAAIQVSTASFHGPTYPDGSFALVNSLVWTNLLAEQKRRFTALRRAAASRSTLPAAYDHLPLADLDVMAAGEPLAYWREWLEHTERDDPYWVQRSHETELGRVEAPICMTTGWYDMFLPWQLRDYAALRAAGATPHLTIGPWSHSSMQLTAQGHRDALAHFRRHLLGDAAAQRELPVRIFVTGAGGGNGGNGGWREYPDWPPPGTAAARWHLHEQAALAVDDPKPSEPDRYRYDPADPTPAVSGPVLAHGKSAPADNRALEARADVLTYTSTALTDPLEVIGPVSVELYVASSLAHTDFFARLCDVHPDGVSMNVCDGVCRVRPGVGELQPDGSLRITIDCWPTAHRFAAGHRLRVQVSSGAHPRFARNPGTGEPLGTAAAATLRAADQVVYHDPEHPSAIILPVPPTG